MVLKWQVLASLLLYFAVKVFPVDLLRMYCYLLLMVMGLLCDFYDIVQYFSNFMVILFCLNRFSELYVSAIPYNLL